MQTDLVSAHLVTHLDVTFVVETLGKVRSDPGHFTEICCHQAFRYRASLGRSSFPPDLPDEQTAGERLGIECHRCCRWSVSQQPYIGHLV